jgi:hypothetical protein
MSPLALTVTLSLAAGLSSMILLVLLHRKNNEPYSHCFWKGFLIGFLLVAGILVALRLTEMIHMAMIFGLPIAFGAGCVTGLFSEIIRNRMMDKGFWKNC